MLGTSDDGILIGISDCAMMLGKHEGGRNRVKIHRIEEGSFPCEKLWKREQNNLAYNHEKQQCRIFK